MRLPLVAILVSTLFYTPMAQAVIVIDADAVGLANGDNISSSFAAQGVLLSTVGGGSVFATTQPGATTGTRAFAYLVGQALDGHWARATSPVLRVDLQGFDATQVSIDFLADGRGSGRIEAFDAANSSLGFATLLGNSAPATLTFSGSGIRAVQVGLSDGNDFGVLDNLRITAVPEPSCLPLITLVLATVVRRKRFQN
jgi:hypothetical protein